MQLPCECMSMSSELNFCEQDRSFKEYFCHLNQIFSTLKRFHPHGQNILPMWQE